MSHDTGQVCACVADHRPAVLELERHHRWPLYLGGPDTEDNIVWVCPSTHASTHEVLRLMLKASRLLTYTEVAAASDRPVPRYAYHLAARGYSDWATPTI